MLYRGIVQRDAENAVCRVCVFTNMHTYASPV